MRPRFPQCRYVTASFIVAMLLSGCVFSVNKRASRGGNSAIQNQFVSPNQIQQNTASAPRTHQFGVLDDNYDFIEDGVDDLPTLRAKFPIHQDDSAVAILKDGPDYLAARWQLLMQAQRSVRLQALVFHGDESGWAIADKLIELKKRGITVQIIIDSLSNLETNDAPMYTMLQQNGIKVEGFEVFYLTALQELSKTDSISNLVDRANMRRHEKMFIVDAELPDKARAIVGGVNIANKYFRVDQSKFEENWSDKDVMLKGPIVADISKNFDENMTTIQDFKNNQAVLNTDPIWKMALFLRDTLKINPIINVTVPNFSPVLKQTVQNYFARTLTLDWKPARMRFLESRPQQKQFYIQAAYIDAIKSAKKEILILNSYFLPTEDMRVALKDAVKRGVNVKILTNDPRIADVPMVIKAGRMIYPELLEVNQETRVNNATLEIYEWAGDAQFGNKQGLHHAKYAIFDEDVVFVGSFNLDPRSRSQNSESIMAFENPDSAASLKAEYMTQIGPTFAVPIDLQTALTFKDPDGFLQSLESQFTEVLTPIF